MKLAVFYDAENISAYAVPKIYKFLTSLGTIIEQEAHGDFSMPLMKPWSDVIAKNFPIKFIHKPHNGDKEVADKSTMNAIATYPIKHPDITIVIVSSDNDFVETSTVLVQYGINVIGIGTRKQSRNNWINSCSEFYFIEDLDIVTNNVNKQKIDTTDEIEIKRKERVEKGVVSQLRKDLGCGFIAVGSYKTYYFSFAECINPDGTVFDIPDGATVTFNVSKEYNPHGDTRQARNGRATNIKIVDESLKPEEKTTGIVKYISNDKKIGFITTKNFGGTKKYFFRFSDIQNYDGQDYPVEKGDKVRFKIAKKYNSLSHSQKEKAGTAKNIEVVNENLSL